MSFRHIGGDILWRTRSLTDDDVTYFRSLFRDEAELAFRAQDERAYDAARSLLAEVVEAQTQQQQWRRAAEPRKAA